MKAIISIFFLLALSSSQQTNCEKYVDQLISNIIKFNFTSIPVPSILYSGITTNNPGQMEQCQQSLQGDNQSKFSYYLITLQNYTSDVETFTGICVPEQCTAVDIQNIASRYIHCNVYQYPDPPEYDYLTYMGAVIISIWIVVLVVWSCYISFKEPVENQFIKSQIQRGSLNAESEQPLMEEDQPSRQQDDYKIFNYYEGYLKIFKYPAKKSVFSPIFAFAVLSYVISIQFSYRQTIAENQKNSAPDLLNSATGVFVCNTEIALETIIFILGLRVAYGTYKIESFRSIGRYFFDQVLKKWVLLILMTLLIYSFMTLFTNQPLSRIWNLNNGQDCPNCMWQMWFLARNLILDTKICLPWMSIFATQVLFTLISAPFLMIFRFNKRLGYGLFALLTLTSMIISFAILDSSQITYSPTKLMNAQKQFVIDYQGNSFVRMGAFFTGLMMGLIVIEGLQKNIENGKTKQYDLAKKIKRSPTLQTALQIIGFAIMITTYLLIIPFLGENSKTTGAYVYLMLVPLLFIYGLGMFILPSFWEGEAKSTVLINRVLGWRFWVHFDKIAVIYMMIGPMMIGFSNYSMQSSIYYDYLTVFTYLLGDIFLTYLLSLVITAAFQNQLIAIISWLQIKIFGNQFKYSVLVIEQ